jgi:carbon monoxide dehydrogenase subunit G
LPTFQASEQFDVGNSVEECWKFVSDLSNVGHCIPGCEEVRPINETTAFFKIKFKVGYLSKTFELKARILEKTPPTLMRFAGSGQDAEIGGKIELSRQDGANHTSIKYSIEIVPISATGKTALTLLGKETVRKQTSEFAVCVKKVLEKRE